MKKVISIALALLMILTVFPLAVFAEGEQEVGSSEARVVAWEENYDLLIDKLIDNESFANWKYVVDNSEEIKNLMNVYTAFGMYDSAWVNAATKNVDIDICKKVIMAMLEEYNYNMKTQFVDDTVKVLGTITDIGEFMETVNEKLGILEFVDSDAWGEAFGAIATAIKVGKEFIEIRDQLIEVFEQIMTVQMANEYYLEMLTYIQDNCVDSVMAAAASELIDEYQKDVKEQIDVFVATIVEDKVAVGLDVVAKLALNSNVYTAVALKVYQVGVKAADVIWNTGDQYELYSALKASFYAETTIAEWVKLSFSEDDYDRTLFAVSSLIATRKFGEETLSKLIKAKSGGIVGRVKSKLFNTVCTEYTANIACLELMSKAFYDTDPEYMVKVESINYVYCPVRVLAHNGSSLVLRVNDGKEEVVSMAGGLGISKYSEYNKEYIKVLFCYGDYDINLVGTADGYVTYVVYVPAENERGFEDYSFTEVAVNNEGKIKISGNSYSVNNGAAITLNDTFVIPEGKTVTAKDVFDATKDVAKEDTQTLIGKIKAIFQKIIDAFKKLFKIA